MDINDMDARGRISMALVSGSRPPYAYQGQQERTALYQEIAAARMERDRAQGDALFLRRLLAATLAEVSGVDNMKITLVPSSTLPVVDKDFYVDTQQDYRDNTLTVSVRPAEKN